jgi:hypothetical protein
VVGNLDTVMMMNRMMVLVMVMIVPRIVERECQD